MEANKEKRLMGIKSLANDDIHYSTLFGVRSVKIKERACFGGAAAGWLFPGIYFFRLRVRVFLSRY